MCSWIDNWSSSVKLTSKKVVNELARLIGCTNVMSALVAIVTATSRASVMISHIPGSPDQPHNSMITLCLIIQHTFARWNYRIIGALYIICFYIR